MRNDADCLGEWGKLLCFVSKIVRQHFDCLASYQSGNSLL